MRLLLDAFWRAAAYCLHPRVILLSIAPLVLAGGLAFGLGWFYWEPAVAGVREQLESWAVVTSFLAWLDGIGAGAFRAVLAPMVVVVLALPVIVVLSLLLVALMMTPSMVDLVARRRFALLERRHGAAAWRSATWSIGCTLLALVALVASMPLWLVPPLVLLLPPLIWGWLTYRVMSYDVLADHASREERRTVIAQHRWPMLAMGIVCGYLGAAPSLIWAVSATLLIFAPVLIVFSIWLYTLVFAFSSLWFAHYALAALQDLRGGREQRPAPAPQALPFPDEPDAPASFPASPAPPVLPPPSHPQALPPG